MIAFQAKLWSAMEGKGWTFVTMPKKASQQLPARARVPIEGTINGFPFRSSAFPDGEGSHNIQINTIMREGANASVGKTAKFVIQPATDAVKVEILDDLQLALKESAHAASQWQAITPKAQAEWTTWITSAKKEETRSARVAKTIERPPRATSAPATDPYACARLLPSTSRTLRARVCRVNGFCRNAVPGSRTPS